MARKTTSTTGRPAPQVQQSPTAEARDAAPSGGDAIEQQVIAFAEQLGRVVGTVQAKAEGWLDTKALSDQVTRVRDSAATLLQQLGSGAESKAAATAPMRAESPAPGSKAGGRSGGVVDAPGKKHRKPVPNQPLRANAADRGRLTKMKAVNASRKRGRG